MWGMLKLLSDHLQERMSALAATILEVVQVESPNHATGQIHRLDQLCFTFQRLLIVVGHPLVVFVGKRTHATLRIAYNLPTLVLDAITNLKSTQYEYGNRPLPTD